MTAQEDVRLLCGDSRALMVTLKPESVDSIVTDPPYGLSFMGKGWDHGVPGVQFWTEALRVAKPGAHLLAFGGTRTFHRLAVAIEDAGWEIRDCVMWVYGSGFPKSLDVSKAIDKQRKEDVEPVRVICRLIRAAMDRIGVKSRHLVGHFDGCHPRLIDHWAARDTDSQPALPTWEQWQKLRDVLAIGHEHDAEVWRLNGRKGQPGDTWQAAEIIGQHEGQTPGFGDHRFLVRDTAIRQASEAARTWQGWGTALKPAWEPVIVARKPFKGNVAANVLAHGTGAINVDGCRVGKNGRAIKLGIKGTASHNGEGFGCDGKIARVDSFDWESAGIQKPSSGRWPANLIHDGGQEVTELLGDAARFFYCPKASKRDRGDGNNHPTVKPTDLMRYLCKLVTPQGGTVLDPFMGSGSTGKAARIAGFRFIGIELDPEYLEIARARIQHVEGI